MTSSSIIIYKCSSFEAQIITQILESNYRSFYSFLFLLLVFLMWVLPICRGAFLGLCVSLLLAVSFCNGNEETAEVVGVLECADCPQSNIKTSQAFSGLRVSIDCKSANGDFKIRGFGDVDEEGKFRISLPRGELEEKECFVQPHSASGAPCPAHNIQEDSKIISQSKATGKQTFGVAGKLKFSPVTCTSAFFWPFFKHPPLPYLPHFPKLPPFPGTPIEFPPFPKYSPPTYRKNHPPAPAYNNPLPPPAPVYNNPLPPPVPITKKPPTYKNPLPPPVPVIKKPLPPPVPIYKKPIPPNTPIYRKPLPPRVPSIKKPLPPPVPIYKKPIPPPTPIFKKPLPPPVPIYNKPFPPPTPIYRKPLPPPVPIYKKPLLPPAPLYKKSIPPPAPIYKPNPPISKTPLPPVPNAPPINKKPYPPIPRAPPIPRKYFGHQPPSAPNSSLSKGTLPEKV